MIEIRNLCKKYGENQVLDSLSLQIEDGETVCIMGTSGCGKTTLLSILMGLVKKDSGTIQGLQGKRIAPVFQEDRLCMDFDAITNVKMVCSRKITDTLIQDHLQRVGFPMEALHQPAKEWSGGMQRRSAIVRAILAPSDILIMDEPLKGLDRVTKQKVIVYIKQEQANRTLLVVTHDETDAIALQGRNFFFKSGCKNKKTLV